MAEGWGAPVGDESAGWGPPSQADAAAEPGWGPPKSSPEMPGVFESLGQGIRAGWKGDLGQTSDVIEGKKPKPVEETSPAAKPFEWSDLTSPIAQGLPKVAYGLGKGSPTLAGGIAGGLAGSAVEPGIGTLVGGIGGSAAAGALQQIGPAFANELKKSPNDPDGAWDRAVAHSAIAGAASGASWGLFPLKAFQGPIKNLAFQVMGIQPGVSVAEKAASNVVDKKPISDDLGEAYVQGAANTAVPMLGHAALSGATRAVGERVRNAADIMPQPTEADTLGKIADVAESAMPNAEAVTPKQQVRIEDPTSAPPPTPEELKGSASGPDTGAEPSRWSSVPFARQFRKMADGWKKTFQPEAVSDLSLQSEGFFREYNSAKASDRDAILYSEDALHNYFERMPEPDRINFMKAAAGEGGIKLPDELVPAYNRYRRLLQRTWQLDKDAGSKMGYIEEYFPREWEHPEQAQEFFRNRIQSLGPKWFQKKRTLDLIQDGLDAGLKLKTTNPSDLVANRLISSVDMRARVKLLKQLEDVGAAQKVPSPEAGEQMARQGWKVVSDPVGNRYGIHPDVQPLWKNVMDSPSYWQDQSAVGGLYRGWMALKNAWVPIKLGLSAFHPLHVAHLNVVDNWARAWQQANTGHPVQALGSAAKGLYGQFYFLGNLVGVKSEAQLAKKAWVTPEWERSPEQKAVVKLMNEGGFSAQLSEELRMKGSRAFNDALSHQDWLRAIPYGAVMAFKKALQEPIFEKWIPTLKTAAYLDAAKELFQRRPDLFENEVQRRAALGAIAKSVDNRYGEMFYSNLFWNRKLKDIGIGSFLSLGWNLGFVREFGGGAIEPFLRKALTETPTRAAINAAKSKTAFSLFYMTNAMILNAAMTKMMSGEDPEGMDYFLPRIGGTNPDGSPRRITNMFYTREIPMAKKHIEEQGGGLLGTVKGLGNMIWNKMMVQPINEMRQNKDYYGFNIYDPEAPAYKQAWQGISHILSDQLNPISITGAKKALQISGEWDDKHPIQSYLKILQRPESALALAGFGPAPAYASKSETQNRLAHLYSTYVSPTERPLADKEVMENRRLARESLLMARQKGDAEAINNAAQNLAELGIKGKAIGKIQPGATDLYLYQRLPQTIQAQFLKSLNKEEFLRFFAKSAKKTKADPEVLQMWRGLGGG